MTASHRVFRIMVFSAILLIFACVTINIYFPAEKVETVAGEIVEDIRGPASENEKKDENAPEEKQGSTGSRPVFASLVSTAYAQEVTEVSNPTIRGLKERMKARYPQLKPWYGKGVLTEGDDGFVKEGDTGAMDIKDKRTLRNLVSAENKDRRQLYSEVAKALNIDPAQVDKVAAIFAKEWQKSVR
jgi:hypothetical protein